MRKLLPCYRLLFGAVGVLTAFFFTACTEPDAIGEGVLSSGTVREVPDTFRVMLRTVTGERFIASDRNDNINNVAFPAYTDRELALLGSWFDPQAGRIDAGIFATLTLTGSSLTFGRNPVADSMVLRFRYHKSFGNPGEAINLRIRELTGTGFQSGRFYYADEKLEVGSEDLGKGIVWTPKIITGAALRDTNSVSFKLDPALATRFLTAPAENFRDDAAFRSFFKGIFMDAVPAAGSGSGNLVSIDLKFPVPEVVLYHRFEADSSFTRPDGSPGTVTVIRKDTTTFPVGVGRYHRHLTRSETAGTLADRLTTDRNFTQNDLSMVQTGTGLKSLIKLDNLASLRERNINYAQLTLRPTVAPAGDTSKTPYPSRLYLFFAADTVSGIEDSAHYVSGTYDRANNQYNFVITNMLQSIVMNRREPYLTVRGLRFPFSDALAERVFLGNFNNTSFRPRLTILYTPKVE